ncbi:unnamed protein product [Closterium sp. NIES-54]
MYVTLYFLTTRLLDSLRTVRDNFLSLDPTELTLASFDTRLLEAETSAHAACRGSPLTSFFEGSVPRLLLVGGAFAATAKGVRVRVVGVTVARVVAVVVVGVEEVVAAVEVAGVVEEVGVVEVVAAVEVAGVVEAVRVVEVVEGALGVELVWLEALVVQPVEAEGLVVGSSSSIRVGRRLSRRSSFMSGLLSEAPLVLLGLLV